MSENIYNFSAGPATLPKSVTDHLKLIINDFDQGVLYCLYLSEADLLTTGEVEIPPVPPKVYAL